MDKKTTITNSTVNKEAEKGVLIAKENDFSVAFKKTKRKEIVVLKSYLTDIEVNVEFNEDVTADVMRMWLMIQCYCHYNSKQLYSIIKQHIDEDENNYNALARLTPIRLKLPDLINTYGVRYTTKQRQEMLKRCASLDIQLKKLKTSVTVGKTSHSMFYHGMSHTKRSDIITFWFSDAFISMMIKKGKPLILTKELMHLRKPENILLALYLINTIYVNINNYQNNKNNIISISKICENLRMGESLAEIGISNFELFKSNLTKTLNNVIHHIDIDGEWEYINISNNLNEFYNYGKVKFTLPIFDDRNKELDIKRNSNKEMILESPNKDDLDIEEDYEEMISKLESTNRLREEEELSYIPEIDYIQDSFYD